MTVATVVALLKFTSALALAIAQAIAAIIG
jgi:hypothetical protein